MGCKETRWPLAQVQPVYPLRPPNKADEMQETRRPRCRGADDGDIEHGREEDGDDESGHARKMMVTSSTIFP